MSIRIGSFVYPISNPNNVYQITLIKDNMIQVNSMKDGSCILLRKEQRITDEMEKEWLIVHVYQMDSNK